MPSQVKRGPFIALILGALAVIALLWSGIAEAAAQKIYYFVNGKSPNTVEAANITKLEATRGPAFDVRVWNIQKVTKCPSTTYIAGNIPAVCRDGGIDSGTPLYTVADPDNPPQPNTLPSNQARIYNGQTVTIAGGGSYTFTVAGSALTAVTYVAPDAGI